MKRSTAPSLRSATSSSRNRRRAAGDREDRGLDPVRRSEPVYLRAQLGQPSGARGRQRAAARQRQHLGNENLTFAIDTLHDRRNGYVFQTNALGALRDMAVTDDQQNQAWNGIWYVKTARFENGWTVEVAIPFKTLRYRDSGRRRGASTCGGS
jgi:hypothetical protein